MKPRSMTLAALALFLATPPGPLCAQGFLDRPEALRLSDSKVGWSVATQKVTPFGGMLVPGERFAVDFTVVNSDKEKVLSAVPVIEVTRIGSQFERFDRSRGDIVFGGYVAKTLTLSEPARYSLAKIDVPGAGKTALHWESPPEKKSPELGLYAVVLELPELGRLLVATFARINPPNPAAGDGKKEPIIWMRDGGMNHDQQMALVAKMGYKWVRTDSDPCWRGAASTDPNGPFDWRFYDNWMKPFIANKLWILSNCYPPPMTAVTEGNRKAANWTHDPKYDAAWGNFAEECARRYCGDGNGPLQMIDFWNEPWEGGGLSYYRADAVRYREMYKILYERSKKGSPHLLIGGASSIMNTVDKFFSPPDGEKVWAPLIDVFTDHYVMPYMSFGPQIAKRFGRFSVETETWLGNTPETMLATVTCCLAAGQKKVTPCNSTHLFSPGLSPKPTAPAISFLNYFVAGREFQRLVFDKHLPLLYQFGTGRKAGFILAGDRYALYGSLNTAAPAALMYDRQIRAAGTITISSLGGRLKAYDMYGNLMPAKRGKYTLPCAFASVYLEAPRLDAQKVIEAVRKGKIEGVRPVEFLVDDFIQPIQGVKALEFEVHNVLTSLVRGTVTVTAPPAIQLGGNSIEVELAPGETKSVTIPVKSTQTTPVNAYEFLFEFKGDAGEARWKEVLHVNTITHGTVTVDGDLSDWSKATPQVVYGRNVKRSATEAIWRPFEEDKEVTAGVAEIRLMWDENNLYVAVRDRNAKWQPKPRLSTRNDDEFFGTDDTAHTYRPEKVGEMWLTMPHTGHVFMLGIGLGLHSSGIGSPDTCPRQMVADDDTDYEYSIWGARDGGAEIWRNTMPGMLPFNFWPRCMPHGYDGVPKGAKAVVKRDGIDTLYEAAIPLSDIKELKPQAGTVIKMTFALPGSGICYGGDRSRTRSNSLSLHASWEDTVSNDIRWGFVKE